MELSRQLDKMNAAELRNLTATLVAQLADRDAQLADLNAERTAHAVVLAKRDAEIKLKQLKIDQLTHEMATLKRWRYDRRSEQMDVVQRSLLDESIDADIEAISREIEALKETPAVAPKEKPRRVALPASFPRREVRHEPDTTQCNFTALYEIEREARELKLTADGRHHLRQQRSKPVAEALRQWLTRQRGQVPDGSATRKAIDYSLGRWAALIRYLDDGELPIDNNHIENRIRPVALGRSNWLFAGSLRAGQRAAAVMSLIQSAKLNGHDPYRYLKDVLERLPNQPASRLEDLLPHRWQSSSTRQ
jgi:hypothetical protein